VFQLSKGEYLMAINFYGAYSHIGGASGDLDNISEAVLADGDAAIVVDSTNNTGSIYTLDSASTEEEDSTNFTVIIPDDEAAAPTEGKRWILVNVFGVSGLSEDGETGADYTAGGALQLNYDDTLAFKTSAKGIQVFDTSGDDPVIQLHGDDENHIGTIQGANDLDLWITTEENSSDIWLASREGDGTQTWCGLVGPDTSFRPSSHKGTDLGTAAAAWDDAYADDYNNVADFYWMDDRINEAGKKVKVDDVQIIKDIKPSNKYDPISGLNIINDSTLPTWLVKKHKKAGEKDGKSWKKGDTALTADGKPYLSLKTVNSLLMGAIRQLDARLTALEGG
jgi:hypothetical protein